MRHASRLIGVGGVGGLVLLCAAGARPRRRPPALQPGHASSRRSRPVRSQGIGAGRKGAPVAGAMVSALGAGTAFARQRPRRTLRAAHAVARTVSAPGAPHRVRRAARADRRGAAERARVLRRSRCGTCRPRAASTPPVRRAGLGRRADAAVDAGVARRPNRLPPRRREPATTITARSRGGCGTRAAAS